jgi:hypothetical protein
MHVSASQCLPHASGKLELVLDFDRLQDCDSLSAEQGPLKVLACGEIQAPTSFGTSEEISECSSSDSLQEDDLVSFEKRSGARSRVSAASRFRIQGRMFACLRREQL